VLDVDAAAFESFAVEPRVAAAPFAAPLVLVRSGGLLGGRGVPAAGRFELVVALEAVLRRGVGAGDAVDSLSVGAAFWFTSASVALKS